MGLKKKTYIYIYIYIFWARRPVSNNWNNRLPSNNHPLSPFWCERRNNHPRILFKEIRYVISFVFVYWKCPAENSGNGSSEPLNLKDFMGSMPPLWARATTWWKYHIQLFREWLSEKMCTWQSPKVIWDMINTVAVEPTFEDCGLLFSPCKWVRDNNSAIVF